MPRYSKKSYRGKAKTAKARRRPRRYTGGYSLTRLFNTLAHYHLLSRFIRGAAKKKGAKGAKVTKRRRMH